MTKTPNPPFTALSLSPGDPVWIPADVNLGLPDAASVEPTLLRRLVSIPWDDRYLALVPLDYRDFFRFVLPHLRVRTTDVHVATCLPFVRDLLNDVGQPVDERVVYVAFILHDAGWSEMSEQEIADSLGVAGLALSATAASPKARHVELGLALARRLLGEYPFVPPLTSAQADLILHAIEWHDRPQDLARLPDAPPTSRLVCDVDHLWSFTHENFWQDTVRKGVDPRDYLRNLDQDLHGYFVTDVGRLRARRMLAERRDEVAAWADWVCQVRDA
jgi:hypothetical protein